MVKEQSVRGVVRTISRSTFFQSFRLIIILNNHMQRSSNLVKL